MGRDILVVDVDQTLTRGLVSSHMGHYNAVLSLGLTPQEIRQSDRLYRKTFDAPAIQKVRETEEGELRFQQAREEIRTSISVLLGYQSIPGSTRGITQLLLNAGLEFGGYFTSRPANVANATHEWLSRKRFPYPEKVVTCPKERDKLIQVLDAFIPEEENPAQEKSVIFIDDNHEQLAEEAERMVEENPNLRRRFGKLVLVGFSFPENEGELEGIFYLKTGIRTLSLPSWHRKNLKNLIQAIKN